jgi:hypothetical protein
VYLVGTSCIIAGFLQCVKQGEETVLATDIIHHRSIAHLHHT